MGSTSPSAKPAGPWEELLEYARWTASPHNIQPWKLRIRSATAADLLYVPSRLLPDTDPTGFFTMVGFGSFLASLEVAAAPLGLAVEARLVARRLDPKAEGLPVFAGLRLAPRDAKAPPE